MFASSLSSAARQPKGRGYSRKQRRIENGGRGEYRPRPSRVNRIPASQKFRFPETQLSSPLIPPPKARECLQSPVVSIRRRLPPTDHVRFTSRAGKCIGMLAFFSSSPPRSLPPPPALDSARGNCWPRRNTPCQSHSRRRHRRKRWLCWARDEIDRRCETSGGRATYIQPPLYHRSRCARTEMAVGKFPADTWNRANAD